MHINKSWHCRWCIRHILGASQYVATFIKETTHMWWKDIFRGLSLTTYCVRQFQDSGKRSQIQSQSLCLWSLYCPHSHSVSLHKPKRVGYSFPDPNLKKSSRQLCKTVHLSFYLVFSHCPVVETVGKSNITVVLMWVCVHTHVCACVREKTVCVLNLLKPVITFAFDYFINFSPGHLEENEWVL